MAVRKPFSKKLYEENDLRAKKAVVNYLLHLGYNASFKEDKKADITAVDKHGVVVRHEAEIKCVWEKGIDWPPVWRTVHIPERKGKLIKNGSICFWIVSNDETHTWLISSEAVEMSPLIEVPNKFVAKGELMFDVPLSLCYFIDLRK